MQSLCRTIKDTIQNKSKLGILPVCILAVSAFIMANAVPQPVLATSDAIAFTGHQGPNGAKPDGMERFVHAPNESARTRVSPSNSDAPYIVDDGVQMYQVRKPSKLAGGTFAPPATIPTAMANSLQFLLNSANLSSPTMKQPSGFR